eukprot:TRINITY_DN2012_c0_g1_i5.p1 TRINITY_DN2012_c0_g1~~TRINITY_DN2012_c0_g1_i5.p1  ORF type:complete len:470 (+),score=80.78 TRINITY_DN2012_c0_g1_i5:220-1629(+)
MNLRLFVILNLYLFGVICAPIKQTNTVAFRLDDIVNDYLTHVQRDIITAFRDENIPLSVVVIAERFNTKDGDPETLTFLKSCMNVPGWKFEIGSHSYDHEDFAEMTLSEQTQNLQKSRTKTIADFGGALKDEDFTTFVPPYNSMNANTVKACKATGFNAISGAFDMDDFGPFPGNDPAIYHWPTRGSTTTDDSVYLVTADVTLSDIKKQMASDGFAAVMTHPDEFAKGFSKDDPTDSTNSSQIANLKRLFQLCRDAGYQFTTLGGLNDVWNGPSTSSTPAPATTGKQAPATTGKAAPATTGKPAPATTGKETPVTTGKPTPATTGKEIPATTGKPAPATTGKPAPATTGKPAPATTGKPAPATTGKPAPATTGKPAPATTGKPAPATTGKTAPATTSRAAPATTAKAAPATTGTSDNSCSTLGQQRCSSNNSYQTCTWTSREQLGWSVSQNCQSGLRCQASGQYVYCVW